MYYSYAMSICIRYANNREDAVEILNDAFMKVFRYVGKFDTKRPFLPWFRRILINVAVDRYNRSKAEPELVELEEGPKNVDPASVIDNLSYEEMLTLVRQLPHAYRTVFNLIAIEGFTHEEVAGLLNISVGTSKSNYSRAKQKLQNYLYTFFEVR